MITNVTKSDERGLFPALPTIRQAAKMSGYPEHLIRSLVAQGLVRSVPAGNRRYVNMDSLLDYITGRE